MGRRSSWKLGVALLAGWLAGQWSAGGGPGASSGIVYAQGGASEADIVRTARAVSPSVVSVRRPGRRQRGIGSGFIVRSDGYILTNSHVVGGNDEVEVTLADGRRYRARVLGMDPGVDTAVLRII